MADNIKDKGILYTVATPIGNLNDITFRAIEILKEADIILAEDKRNSSVLLNKYNINTKLESYHKFNENEKTKEVIELLKEGKNIALITDAGTPLVSDPGNIIIKKAIEENIKIVPSVGACALIGLIQSVYRKDEDFKFIGFLPKNKNQILEILNKNRYENLIFYESPKRIVETLKIIAETMPYKKIAYARELTKKFEEIKVLNIKEALNTINPKGEFCLMLLKDEIKQEIDCINEIEKLKKLNYSNKDIANIISALFEVNKNSIKKLLNEK